MRIILLAFINSVFSQNCNNVSPVSIVDLDSIPLAAANCGVENLINPIGALPPNYDWDPSYVPSTGYYRLTLSFAQPTLITSCDWWANTDGTHSPTGMKFFTQPGGTLLASTA